MPINQQSVPLPSHPLPALPTRTIDSHKGLFGHALIVSGQVGMLGATLVAGQACLRSGAGLTTLAVPISAQLAINVAVPCAMTIGLSDIERSETLEPADCQDWLTALATPRLMSATLAIGPGLGRHPKSDLLVKETWRNWTQTAVFDADALNVLAEHTTLPAKPLTASPIAQAHSREHPNAPEQETARGLTPSALDDNEIISQHIAPRIITPHPGEWERLSGVSRKDRVGQIEAAKHLAAQWNIIVVLKGSKTFVTNGRSEYLNTTGNPSMAVGGSGDCLTGIITALLCQGLAPMEAAILGVHLHGSAGDIAHEQLGAPSTLATDLIEFLPQAFSRQETAEEILNESLSHRDPL